MRIKRGDIPAITAEKARAQGGICPLCGIKLSSVTPCLDHDHETGLLRGVLCLNCNGMEGKVINRARRASRGQPPVEWLKRLMLYYAKWEAKPDRREHWTFKSAEEKRLERNAKARLARARKAATKLLKDKAK